MCLKAFQISTGKPQEALGKHISRSLSLFKSESRGWVSLDSADPAHRLSLAGIKAWRGDWHLESLDSVGF